MSAARRRLEIGERAPDFVALVSLQPASSATAVNPSNPIIVPKPQPPT